MYTIFNDTTNGYLCYKYIIYIFNVFKRLFIINREYKLRLNKQLKNNNIQ